MRSDKKTLYIPCTVVAAGAAGAALRTMLYAFGYDSKHLLNPADFRNVLCWVITAGIALFLFITVRKLNSSRRYRDNFPPCPLCMVGELLACMVLLGSVLQDGFGGGTIGWIRFGLLLAGSVCMVLSGFCRFRGRRPHVLIHGILCIFFATDMICRYQAWSGNPQVIDYYFSLFASVFLTLSAYYRTAFSAGQGSRRRYSFCILAALYLCMLAAPGPDSGLFYLGGALWAASNLCAPGSRQPKKKKEEEI